MTEFMMVEAYLLKRVREVATRLYSEQRMTGDEMRNAAQQLQSVFDNAIPESVPATAANVAQELERIASELKPSAHAHSDEAPSQLQIREAIKEREAARAALDDEIDGLEAELKPEAPADETAHLMRSPKNARRLLEAIDRARSGDAAAPSVGGSGDLFRYLAEAIQKREAARAALGDEINQIEATLKGAWTFRDSLAQLEKFEVPPGYQLHLVAPNGQVVDTMGIGGLVYYYTAYVMANVPPKRGAPGLPVPVVLEETDSLPLHAAGWIARELPEFIKSNLED